MPSVHPEAAKRELQSRRAQHRGDLYEPNDRKIGQWHESNALVKAFLGGNGSGKTTAGCMELRWALTGKHPYNLPMCEPPIRARVYCTDYLHGLQEAILPAIDKWIPAKWFKKIEYRQVSGAISSGGGKRYPASYITQNGSQLDVFTYAQMLEASAGGEVDFVWFDEPPPLDLYEEATARLRASQHGRCIITCTALETEWIHDVVVKGADAQDKADQNPVFHYIHMDADCNPHVNDEQRRKIFAAMSEDGRLQRKQGFTGTQGRRVLPEFKESLHVVPRGLVEGIPMTIFQALDIHTKVPFEIRWMGVDKHGRYYILRDESPVREQFYSIPRLSERIEQKIGTPEYRMADTNAKNYEPTGQMTMQQALLRGPPNAKDWKPFPVHFPEKKAGSRETGIATVKALLEPNSRFTHPKTGKSPAPQLYILNCCETSIADFKRWSYVRSTKRRRDAEDIAETPRNRYSHTASCVIYLVRRGLYHRDKPKAPKVGIPGRAVATEVYDPVTGAPI